jgi:hypothetical protein
MLPSVAAHAEEYGSDRNMQIGVKSSTGREERRKVQS